MRRGFSIAEVMIAIGIVSALAISLIGLFLSARIATESGDHRTKALALSEEALLRYKAETYAKLQDYLSSPPPSINVVSNGINFSTAAEFERLDSSSSSPEYNLIQITTTTTWAEKKSLAIAEESFNAQESESRLSLKTVVGPSERF